MEWKYLKYDLEYRWENFKLRKWINDNPLIMMIATGVSSLIFLIIILTLIWPSSRLKEFSPEKVWYYDLNTGELFAGKANQNPPIEAPSGSLADGNLAGVLAYVYCSSQNEDAKKNIAFIEKLTDEAKYSRPNTLSPSDQRTQQEIEVWNKGRLIKRIDDVQWVSYDSPEGKNLIQQTELELQKNNLLYYSYPDQ